MIRRVAYLCLQTTREGQASYAHVNEIVNGLRRRGVTVDLYEPEDRAGLGPVRKLLAFLGVQLRLIFHLADYDAIYLRGHFAQGPAIFAAWVLLVPQVHEVNGPMEDLFVMYPWTRPLAGLITRVVRFQHHLADAIVTVTPQMAAWCATEFRHRNIFVIPNGANLEFFHPGARSPQAPAGSYAVFFGAFSPWQGIATMLEAVQHPEWPQGTRLVLAGDGTERPRVEAAAAAGDRVLYLGVVPYRDLAGFVAPAAVGLCVKNDEGGHAGMGWSPLKLYEMMATGIPVVVSDLAGQADVVDGAQAGLVVPPGDAGALAKAVARLVQDPAERRAMGERGSDLVLRNHSWDRRAQDTWEILQGVARGAGTP